MKVSDLKIKKETITTDLLAIRDLAKTEDRVLTAPELEQVEVLSRSLKEVDGSIALEVQADELARNLDTNNTQTTVTKVKKKKFDSLTLVRQLVDNAGRQTEDIIEVNRSVAMDVNSQGVFISRAGFTYGTEGADMSPSLVEGLTITESPVTPPLWKQMGVTVYPSLNGGTQRLPFMSPILAEEVAEGVDITQTPASTNHVELVPSRVGVQIAVSREGLATYNAETWNGVMANVLDAIDRKITAKIYAAAYAGATIVAGATTFSKTAFDLLEGSVPVDGKYMMSRKSFFTAKGVAIDTGSGKFLANRVSQDYGETYEGSPIFHSGLFVDAATTKYTIYGSFKNICLGFWGNDAYEIIVDPYTNALGGNLLVTVSRILDVKIPDAAIAFVKSVDLDPTS